MQKAAKTRGKSINSSKKLAPHRKTKSFGKKLIASKSKLRRAKAFQSKKLTKDILRRRIRRAFKNKSKIPRGVVYLGHIPHGFYEGEMRQFFKQFGKVTNINIPSSNRTGKYRGYGFVEFEYPEVAKIVAETMDNYLMFQKVLKAKYIPPKEQKPLCFRFRKYKTPLIARRRKFLRRQNYRVLSDQENNEVVSRLHRNLAKKKRKLEKLGLSYDFQVDNNEPLAVENVTAVVENEDHVEEINAESPSESISRKTLKPVKKKKKIPE